MSTPSLPAAQLPLTAIGIPLTDDSSTHDVNVVVVTEVTPLADHTQFCTQPSALPPVDTSNKGQNLDGNGDADSLPAQSEVAQPPAAVLPAQLQPWSTGPFDCMMDPSNMFDTLLCTMCVASQQYNRLYNNVPRIHWGVALLPLCIDVLLPTGGIPQLMLIFLTRIEVRKRYNITNYAAKAAQTYPEGYADEQQHHISCGEVTHDLCLTLFCPSCVLCQNHREMTLRSEWPGSCLFGKEPHAQITATPTEATIV